MKVDELGTQLLGVKIMSLPKKNNVSLVNLGHQVHNDTIVVATEINNFPFPIQIPNEETFQCSEEIFFKMDLFLSSSHSSSSDC